MKLSICSIKNLATLLLIFMITYYPCERVNASSQSDTVSGLKVGQISSLKEMRATLTILQSCFLKAKQNNQPTFNLQKLILTKAGACVSKIIELEQKSSDKAKRDEARSLLLEDREVIKDILSWNQDKIEYLQENKLDQMEDTTSFFNSLEWQQPQYLISLASYWLSWNGYYSSLLHSTKNTFREELLEKAVEGFSRTFIDFKEESIVIKSLFGRALCYKEMQKYDKATNDINSVLGKITQDNPLYVRSRYEKVIISYLTGNYESALSQLKLFREEVSARNITRTMDAELKKLRVKVILAISEKERKKQGTVSTNYYQDALQELKKLAADDVSQAGEVYQFVNEHAATLYDLPYAELGPIGYLAIADWYFNQTQYDKAIVRYQRITSSSDRLITMRMDSVYFRLGYCLCQKEQWQEATSSFESLFKSYPRSSFAGKAACLYYVAAASNYKENSGTSSYKRYIEAIKSYLQHCADPKDKSEAHFQLGNYYQERGEIQNALKEFSLVGKDSPNYTEARYYVVQSNIDRLESFNKRGLQQSRSAKTVYQDTRRQLDEYQALMRTQKKGADTKELEAHITLLQAKLYIFGPEKTYRKALQKLNSFETRFPYNKQLCLMAKSLRMECYQRLQMFKEAKGEINSFLKHYTSDADQWTFLNECANKFYEEAKRLRNGESNRTSQQTEIALMVYEKLLSIASRNVQYKKFYDAIQLRVAETYMDGKQREKAKATYQEIVERDPQSADAIQNLALIYEEEGQWEEALAAWRKFSRGLETGSYYWFESKYRTAKVLNQLGKKEEACEIITVIHVLHPELRDEEFKKKFTKLQGEVCRKEVN